MYICVSDDADLCKEIIAIVPIVYRPITLEELNGLVQSLEEFQTGDTKEVIGLCGSFLTTRNGAILFVHRLAEDYLLPKVADEIFLPGLPTITMP
jgi:hypothetical protein